MEGRPLGKTGLMVSKFGFGASPLGSVFRDVDEAEGIRAVHRAIDLGVNLFDVSPYYGLTRAETVLGKALETVPRDRFILSTKVGRFGPHEFDFSPQRVAQSVEESLTRLNVQHIDLIHCHDIEFVSVDYIVEETLPALQSLRDQGKVRFIGISGLPLNIFRLLLDRAQVDVVLSYCHYSLNDTSLLDLIPFLSEKGVGIISAAPLAMGLLTRQGPPEWHPAPAELKAACREAAEFCATRGVDIAELALQFSLDCPDIDTTLIGIGSAWELEKNVGALNTRMDTDLLSEVREILKSVQNLSWSSGLSENN